MKDIGGEQKVGEAVSHSGAKEGAEANQEELKKVLKAFQGIVGEAGKLGVAKPAAGEIAVKVGGSGTNNSNGAKILSTSTTQPAAGDEGKAAAILAGLSGKQMLASIVNSKDTDEAVGGGGANGTTSAVSFALGGQATHLANVSAKAAAVAGGIALRSLIKSGTLARTAADGQPGGKEDVQKVGVTAVNKLLIAVEDMIKETVKKVLDKAKGEIDKARDSKTTVQ